MSINNKKEENIIIQVDTISRLHEISGLSKPNHPLVTIIDYSKVKNAEIPSVPVKFVLELYSVNYKKHCKFVYGRQKFDHQEGTLHCTAPGQVIEFDPEREEGSTDGWGLYFHPELIRNSSLAKKIHEFTFFSYNENEALHLSEQEKQTLLLLLKQMEKEYNTNIDHYSDDLIITNIELLLNYCKRYYGRQFITRTNYNKDIITEFERFLSEYINSSQLKEKGVPSVKYCAEKMHLTPNYFSDLLKSETGKNTQEHIHYNLLEKAKTILLSTNSTVNEIADELGFEYPQYFSKLFKKKTGMIPTIFRAK